MKSNSLIKNHWFRATEIKKVDLSFQQLMNDHILTKAIKQKYQHYSLKLISQKLDLTPTEDQQALNIQDQKSLIRRVLQNGNDIALCYARTTVPLLTFEKYQNDFENLADKPIGETLLHNNPAVKRSNFEFCYLNKNNSLLDEVIQVINIDYQALWARRSIFWIKTFPLLITEVFLPDFFEKIDN